MKLNEYFDLREFLSPAAWNNLQRMLAIVTYIREKSGQPVIINNWHRGGSFTQRGLRLPDTEVGAPGSQHRLFNAVDINIGNWPAVRMHEFVRTYAMQLYTLGLRRVEDISVAPTWLHLDGKEHGERCIQVINRASVTDRYPLTKF
ncbi:MAG: D-Ala-D-Ala carboxypeptidase family metallohydrolase [bacterium]|nr:D-Ala-D-Ala carboxypeptidase family metallohydrolase [bacterium]